MLIHSILLLIILHLTFCSEIPRPSEFNDITFASDDPKGIKSQENLLRTNLRVINGFPATLGQFPHAIFLLMKSDTNKNYGCGGSLVKLNWILTAAHCLKNKMYGFAYAGVVDIFRGPYGSAEKIELDQMYPHPKFMTSNPNFQYDIGLIKLLEKFPETLNIGTIDLPCNCPEHYNINGVEITATGFGSTDVKTPGVSPLKYISMTVMEQTVCQKYFEIQIQDSMLCSNTSLGMTTCLGDSGSGLIANIQNHKVLVGVVSFGNVYCSAGSSFPSVSSKVSSYLDWIHETFDSNSA
ncbi:unnamed protein product [Chironomus riparius]|uniref:Peptidase S1 domain-containing protein n=1 Tax=Chironomus riparius TaxID=315576 RepID=A0A9N9X015_9DIPT|nr:unnamed protein product [Chironomus riparius]